MKTVGALLACLLALAGGTFAASAAPGSAAWWQELTLEQQVIYLEGFLDVAYFEASPRPEPTRFSAHDLAEIVRTRISRFPGNNMAILELVMSMPLPQPRQKLPGGEIYTGPHGYYTGEYWRQLDEAEKLVFLLGYVEASKLLGTNPRGVGHPVEWCVDRVSTWFGTSPTDPSELDATRADVPIADALRAVTVGKT